MSNKFSIGVVVAIVLQVSAFVWWTAQQAQTIQTLEGQVKELTAKSEIEKEVQLASDVANLKKDLEELKENTLQSIIDIDNMRISEDTRLGAHIDERIEGLGSYVDERLQDITNNIVAEFQKHEGWIDDLYVDYEDAIEALDKKLSDRIKDLE